MNNQTLTLVRVAHRKSLRKSERGRPRDFGKTKQFSERIMGSPGSASHANWMADFGRNGYMVQADFEAGNYLPYGFDAITIQLIEDAKRGGVSRAQELEAELAAKEAEIQMLRKLAEAAEKPKRAAKQAETNPNTEA
jgi:hypothetical protein